MTTDAQEGSEGVTGTVDPASAGEEMPLLGEDLPVELANSLYHTGRTARDFLDSPDGLRSWLVHAPAAAGIALPHRFTTRSVDDVRQVRDAVRLLLADVADDTAQKSSHSTRTTRRAVATLEAAARRAPAHIAFEVPAARTSARHWTVRYDGPREDVVVAELAGRSIMFLGDPDATLVRRCARPGCPMLFVRRHRARRYCHESCAHSLRQAKYYRAHGRGAGAT